MWLGTRPLTFIRAEIVLVTDIAPGAFAISLNAIPVGGFARVALPAPYGGLPAVRINAAFAGGIVRNHTIVVTNAGGFGAAGAPIRLEPGRLKDLMLVVEYTA